MYCRPAWASSPLPPFVYISMTSPSALLSFSSFFLLSFSFALSEFVLLRLNSQLQQEAPSSAARRIPALSFLRVCQGQSVRLFSAAVFSLALARLFSVASLASESLLCRSASPFCKLVRRCCSHHCHFASPHSLFLLFNMQSSLPLFCTNSTHAII